jgi:hypothetical protein
MNDEFRALYPMTPNAELAKRFGKSEVTILKWAARCGLRKSPEYRSVVQRANATGRIMTSESKAKVAEKARGRTWTTEQRAKIMAREIPRGSRHYRWKGGKPWQRFIDERYRAWRQAVLERDGYVCQDCGRQCRKHERGLAAHHVQPYADHPGLRFEVANGLTLCRMCHLGRHGRAPQLREPIQCACGCGARLAPNDVYGRPRRFVNHHHTRGRRVSEQTKRSLSEQRKGITLSAEHRQKIAEGLRNSSQVIGRPRSGGN